MENYENCIGIDISKESLSICLFNGITYKPYELKSNDKKSAARIIKHYKLDSTKTIIVMENTGVYHSTIRDCFIELGFSVATENAYKIKSFGQMKLLRVKTDTADARLIAEYGFKFNPTAFIPKDPIQDELVLCLKLMKQYKTTRTRYTNREESHENRSKCPKYIEKHILDLVKYLDKQIAKINQKINLLIKEHYKDLSELYTSIPSIGPIISATFIAHFGRFENFKTAKQVQSFIGICASPFESGTSVKGSGRISKRGYSEFRRLLYLAAMTAKDCNPFAKQQYDRLTKNNKNGQLAIIAASNKLIKQMFAIVKSGVKFDAKYLEKREISLDY